MAHYSPDCATTRIVCALYIDTQRDRTSAYWSGLLDGARRPRKDRQFRRVGVKLEFELSNKSRSVQGDPARLRLPHGRGRAERRALPRRRKLFAQSDEASGRRVDCRRSRGWRDNEWRSSRGRASRAGSHLLPECSRRISVRRGSLASASQRPDIGIAVCFKLAVDEHVPRLAQVPQFE